MSDWRLWAWCVVGAILYGLLMKALEWIDRNRHHHRFVDQFGGVYADEPGGPRYVHEIWWECKCGKVIDEEAKRRAEFCDKHNITYVKRGEWPSVECYFG